MDLRCSQLWLNDFTNTGLALLVSIADYTEHKVPLPSSSEASVITGFTTVGGPAGGSATLPVKVVIG